MLAVSEDFYEHSWGRFIGYYAQIVQRAKEIQPRAKIFLVTPPQLVKEHEERFEKYKIVRELIEGLTKLFENTYLADLFTYAPKKDKEFAEKFWLGHMNPMGYVLAARMIESCIDYIIRKNPNEFNQVGFIGTDLYYEAEGNKI